MSVPGHAKADVFMSFDIAAAADADRTDKLFKVPAGRKLRILEVQIVMPAGLAEHTTNAALLALKKGATVIASMNTDSDLSVPDASIAADATTVVPLSATDANRVVPGGTDVTWGIDESGTTTVPAHRLNIFARWV